MTGCLGTRVDVEALDAAVRAHAPAAVEFLRDLVAQPSTLGREAGAQEVLASRLQEQGFEVVRLPIPVDIGDDPAAGVPSLPYAGRYDVVGERGPAGRRLLLNGHIDVVPAADTSRWSSDPWSAVERDGWLHGRGAGDMKAGFAAGLLALRALDEVDPAWLRGRLTFVSAIEEECTGNGTLAAARAGYLADVALLLEPTDLQILLGGVAIIWVGIEVEGRAGHAEAALRSVNPILAALPVLEALRGLEQRMNDEHTAEPDPAFAHLPHPYNVNVGGLHSGDWASSVPAVARVQVRVGHPGLWTSEDALEQVRAAVAAAAATDPWLCEHPPRLALTGFRAERHAQDPDAELVKRLRRAHSHAHGSAPSAATIGSTTDARFYLNQYAVPTVAYGPRARNIHGTDEAVELASIVDCARTVARFLADWYAGPGQP